MTFSKVIEIFQGEIKVKKKCFSMTIFFLDSLLGKIFFKIFTNIFPNLVIQSFKFLTLLQVNYIIYYFLVIEKVIENVFIYK